MQRNRLYVKTALLLSSFLLSQAPALAGEPRPPVVVELFTSQGCSSCPPADGLLGRIAGLVADEAQVIPLSEHVDYWNYLGWRDPFSDKVFTDRQRDYAVSFGQRGVFTPEMVVDGVRGFNGASESAAREAIVARLRAKKERLSVRAVRVKDSIEVGVSRSPGVGAGARAGFDSGRGPSQDTNHNLIVCLTQDNLSVPVRSGENSGRRLSHQAVVRVMKKVENPGGQVSVRFELDPGWKLEDMHAVAFLQDRKTKEITGAGTSPVSVR
ncbi:MAG: DUF1223 domain-containing protein [Candidatus Obscuribacterales bacterium]